MARARDPRRTRVVRSEKVIVAVRGFSLVPKLRFATPTCETLFRGRSGTRNSWCGRRQETPGALARRLPGGR
jgi:hypothetical protein